MAALLAVVAAALAARADDGGTGSVAGGVRALHAPPRSAAHAILRQQAVCGRSAPDESVVLGPNGALAGAVVWIEGLARPAGLRPGTARLDQQGCRFVPHVMTATTGATIELGSQDALLHTVHAVLGARRTLFNVALPMAGITIRKRLAVAGRVHFRCDVGHTWMSAFLWVFDHPWHAVSAADGSFRIEGVPAGERTLRVAHERLGERRLRVRVPAGGRVDVAIEL